MILLILIIKSAIRSHQRRRREEAKGWHARGKISKTKRSENGVIFESPHKKCTRNTRARSSFYSKKQLKNTTERRSQTLSSSLVKVTAQHAIEEEKEHVLSLVLLKILQIFVI